MIYPGARIIAPPTRLTIPHHQPTDFPLADRLRSFYWMVKTGYHVLAPGEPGYPPPRRPRSEYEQIVWRWQQDALVDRFWGLVLDLEKLEREAKAKRPKGADALEREFRRIDGSRR